jgi:hypothetical protein
MLRTLRTSAPTLSLALLIALPPALSADGTSPDLVARTLERVADEAGCAAPRSSPFHEEASGLERDELRRWCAAAEGWAKGTAAEPPAGGGVWMGTAVILPAGQVTAARLQEPGLLTALVLSTEGGGLQYAIRSIFPDNPDEAAEIDTALRSVSRVLAGADQTATVAAPLAEFARSLRSRPRRSATKTARGWTVPAERGVLPGELRRVGPWWVAVERDGDKALWLAVFTDRWTAPAPPKGASGAARAAEPAGGSE